MMILKWAIVAVCMLLMLFYCIDSSRQLTRTLKILQADESWIHTTDEKNRANLMLATILSCCSGVMKVIPALFIMEFLQIAALFGF